jgi:hypothetical protein
MKERFITVLLVVGMFPMTALVIGWGIIWIFTGRFYLNEYYNYVDKRIFKD